MRKQMLIEYRVKNRSPAQNACSAVISSLLDLYVMKDNSLHLPVGNAIPLPKKKASENTLTLSYYKLMRHLRYECLSPGGKTPAASNAFLVTSASACAR
jgi:hypothetical protein